MNNNTQCPKCQSKDAKRILKENRYYIYCVACGFDGLAKPISAIKKEIDQIYGETDTQ